MEKTLKYVTKKNYENIPAFMRRVKAEVGILDHRIISTSPRMSGGVKVLHLVSNRDSNSNLKLEVPEVYIDELKSFFDIKKKATKKKTPSHGLKDLKKKNGK